MIGVYKITNKITGNFYIGSSVNIKERFMSHKTPKATGNDRLHNDMKKYGLENFEFEVIEECEIQTLRAKEYEYIRKCQPYYNYIGKRKTKEFKKMMSKKMKVVWENSSEEHKRFVIENNLKGPRKGHPVSKEKRKKLSKWVSENQGQKVKIVETGQVFNKIKDLENYLGACTGTCASYWKGKIKTVKGYHVEKV